MGKVADRILAKVTRAEQHIQDFQLALDAFYNSGPYVVSSKEDPLAGQRVYYVTKADRVPDALTAIAADAIQNLRSPLDHIAYQLVLDGRGGREPDWKVYYPISRSAADYKGTRGGQIKGVRKEVIEAIDATEPYKGGKGHALWQLNELNKPDKHELLIGAGVHHGGFDIMGVMTAMMEKTRPGSTEGFDIAPLFLIPGDRLQPLKVGHELLRIPLDAEMKQNQRFIFDVSFDKVGVIEAEPALKTLQDMANLVGSIVRTLGRFLP